MPVHLAHRIHTAHRGILVPAALAALLVVAPSCSDENAPVQPRAATKTNAAPLVTVLFPHPLGTGPGVMSGIPRVDLSVNDDGSDGLRVRLAWVFVGPSPTGSDWDDAVAAVLADPDALDWEPWAGYTPGDGDFMRIRGDAPMDEGGYVLVAQARDAPGRVSPLDDNNVVRVRVSYTIDAWPLLSVHNAYFGTSLATGILMPPRIEDALAGVDLVFDFHAEAEQYGGLLDAYRYGWDIDDLSADEQWAVPWTPLREGETITTEARAFDGGVHALTIEVRDDSGFLTRFEMRLNVIPYAATRDVLVVDDFAADEASYAGWDNPLGRGIVPNDAEHDRFWIEVLDDVAGFNAGIDMVEVDAAHPLSLSTLSPYRGVVWNVSSEVDLSAPAPLLHDIIRFPWPRGTIERVANIIAMYIDAGGRLLLVGRHPVLNAINRRTGAVRFPFVFLYEEEGQQNLWPHTEGPARDSFAWGVLCLDAMDVALPPPGRTRSGNDVCARPVRRHTGTTAEHDDALREALPIDPVFPRLHMHARAAGAGKYYEPDARGLDTEIYNPRYFRNLCASLPVLRSCFAPVYGLHCLDSAVALYGEPVAFWAQAPLGGPRNAVFGFPLVYFETDEVRGAVDRVLLDEWGFAGR